MTIHFLFESVYNIMDHVLYISICIYACIIIVFANVIRNWNELSAVYNHIPIVYALYKIYVIEFKINISNYIGR